MLCRLGLSTLYVLRPLTAHMMRACCVHVMNASRACRDMRVSTAQHVTSRLFAVPKCVGWITCRDGMLRDGPSRIWAIARGSAKTEVPVLTSRPLIEAESAEPGEGSWVLPSGFFFNLRRNLVKSSWCIFL